MNKEFSVGVVGATGMVGRQMLEILSERGFPAKEVRPLASARGAGEKIEIGESWVTVKESTPDNFKGLDVVLMSAGGGPSKDLAPQAVEAGAVVIDNSSAWRMDPEVPLVVPEVNPDDIKDYDAKGIIANPNCSTIQMLVALAPLHRSVPIKRIVVSTYQAVSGAGKQGSDELAQQVSKLFNSQEVEPQKFSKRIAFNCLPHIDVFQDDLFTKEEVKMREETRKILHAPDMGVCATCVRVPVFNGHAESINVEFEDAFDAKRANAILKEAPGIFIMDAPQDNLYPTQVDCDGSDATFIGRMRDDTSQPNTITFWCVADNLRKGAATNAVQIAEILVRDYLSKN